jgi:hypothetical protein
MKILSAKSSDFKEPSGQLARSLFLTFCRKFVLYLSKNLSVIWPEVHTLKTPPAIRPKVQS